MTIFLLGLILFIGAHLFTALARGPRAALIGKIGEAGYKGAFALVALIGLVLVVRGWPQADTTVLYVTPYWLRHLTYLLVLIAFILVAAAYLPAGKIAAGAKHPMLAGVKVWAFAHLLVNGDVRSVLLFGSILAWAVINRIALKKRGDNGRAAGPLLNDIIAVGAGAAGFVAVFVWLHPYIAGVALH